MKRHIPLIAIVLLLVAGAALMVKEATVSLSKVTAELSVK